MSDADRTLYIYTMPQEMPCGPASSCCGPIGQTEEEVSQLRWGLEQMVPGIRIEVVNVRQKLNFQRDAAALKVIQTFGPVALPVLVMQGQVVSIGPPQVPELVARLKAKLTSSQAPTPA